MCIYCTQSWEQKLNLVSITNASRVWMWNPNCGWIQIKKILNPMEFPLFSHAVSLSLSLSFLASLHSIFVFDCENKYSEFRFYSHALVSMNNEGCWFCENKNVDTTQHQHKEPKWEKEQKMVTSEESVLPRSIFPQCFLCVFFLLYFIDDFSILNLFFVWAHTFGVFG